MKSRNSLRFIYYFWFKCFFFYNLYRFLRSILMFFNYILGLLILILFLLF